MAPMRESTFGMVRLRPSVSIERLADGSGRLLDAETGFGFDLSPDALGVVERLPTDPATVEADVAEFLTLLGTSGLTESASSAAALQSRFQRRQTDERQWPQLLEVLRHAAAHTSFHRRLSPLLVNADTPDALERLPVMRREDVRAGFPDALVPDDVDLNARLAAQDFVLATTSGTADERLQVLSDTNLARYPFDFEAWWNLGPRPTPVPRTAVFTSAICAGPTCHLGKATMAERTFAEYTLFLNSTEDLFGLDESLARNALEEIAAFKADLFFVNPVYLTVLIRTARALGLELPRPRVVVSCYQMLTARHRAFLSQALNCPVIDYYSATEFGGSIAAMECNLGVMHVWPERVRLEVLGADGTPVTGDQPGHIAVTTLNRSLPLVRYLVGDLGRFVETPCRCAHGGDWPAIRIEGRAKSAFVIDGRVVTPRAVDDALAAAPIDFYRLEERPGDFLLRFIPTEGQELEAAHLQALEALVQRPVVTERTHRFRPERSQKYPTTVPLGAGASAPGGSR